MFHAHADSACCQRDDNGCEAGYCMSEVTSRTSIHPASAPGEGAASSPLPSQRWTPTLPDRKIEVAPRAISTVAGRAVAECYGVVGIAARTSRFGRVELLEPEHYSRGVVVRFAHDHVT